MENQHQANPNNNHTKTNIFAEIDAVGETLRALHDKIDAECNDNYQALGGFNASTTPELDTAYAACEAVSEAKRNLQTGLMWLKRAVVKPSSF
jgi:hypothetical protein